MLGELVVVFMDVGNGVIELGSVEYAAMFVAASWMSGGVGFNVRDGVSFLFVYMCMLAEDPSGDFCIVHGFVSQRGLMPVKYVGEGVLIHCRCREVVKKVIARKPTVCVDLTKVCEHSKSSSM
jgi:hypothetical protein